MAKPAREYLASLIAGNHIQEALDILLSANMDLKKEVRREIQLLSSRFNEMNHQRDNKLRDPRELDIEANQIKDALLKISASLPEELRLTSQEEKKITRRNWRLLITSIGYVAAAALIWWISISDKQNIGVKLDLQLSRLAFTPDRRASLFQNEKVHMINLQNFSRISIQADSLEIDSDFDGTADEHIIPDGPIFIQPIEGLSSVSLQLSTSSVEDFSVLDSAFITVTHVEDDPQRFRLQIKQNDTIRGRLNYANQLELQGAYLEGLNGFEEPKLWEEPVKLIVHSNSENARAVSFSGYPEDFVMELELADSFLQKDLLVRHIEFLRPEQQDIKSSLLGGQLTLQELDKESLREVPILEGERLDLELKERFGIQKLNLKSSGIFLQANGKASAVYTFLGGERRSRNPSRIEWLWHNMRWEISVLGVLLLAILVLLPGPISNRLVDVFKLVKN